MSYRLLTGDRVRVIDDDADEPTEGVVQETGTVWGRRYVQLERDDGTVTRVWDRVGREIEHVHTCGHCGQPRPDGGDLCPRCQDGERAQVLHGPTGHPTEPVRTPPHGNTTR